ncbi:BEL1-like homeodomain protein 8 [Mercurialis annua]|uniref:BEL1-like homeodomain protein 8 n=1 Tax=Mercurialis annua TaxID=3986 RepID=UPI00215F92BF|nr:BEL1-like homeodomain protein 8 [Mercurialis annua]
MDTSSFRSESHVAQQSRRDKLRIQATSSSSAHHFNDYPNNLQHFSLNSGLNQDLVQVRSLSNNVLYDPIITTEMINFGNSSSVVAGDSTFTNMSHQSHPKTNTNDPQGCNWRTIDSHQSYDLMVNYNASGSSETNQKRVFVGDVLSNNANNMSTNYNGYDHQDVHQSSLANPSLYHSTLQDFAYGTTNQISTSSTASYFDNANSWMNRPIDNNCHQWRTIGSDHNITQGLSLSLSSNPDPPVRGNVCHFGEGYSSDYLQSRPGLFKEPREDSKEFVKQNYLPSPMLKPAIISKSSCGKSLHEKVVATPSNAFRNSGPLGPFTGYATILKNSRFLKPAQELLDEFCDATGLKLMRTGDALANAETSDRGNNNSGVSSTLYNPNHVSGGDLGAASSSGESYRPECQQRKAKLLFLQEEVCRKYKQYHQQMQMVASSFDAVAGLSAATPYVSLALKTISRNFRFLKLAISDQLKHVAKALGEDMLTHNAGASSSKGDVSTSRMRHIDQSFQRNKLGGANVGIFEPQQHVWRPQRGLPERSVAILRAWLFEHFLHPYPTDTDKHMLATQTGLSRNQVSNWFINARVRVWKPMVEEIHMLETKGVAETNRTTSRNDGKSKEGTDRSNHEQALNTIGASSMLSRQMECSGSGSSGGSGDRELEVEHWDQEKRSRVDHQFRVPTCMDTSMMNFLPYQRSGIDIGGGIGAVSLTLGLRRSAENVQQQQHEDQLIGRQFGGQMIRDFAG